MKIAVVGAGISAHYFLYLLSKKNLKCEIHWIYDSNIFPANNNEITPIISLNGITKGNSPLGDLLFESYHQTVRDLISNFPDAFEKVPQYFLMSNEEKFVRRHGDFCEIDTPFGTFSGYDSYCYKVCPQTLKKEILSQIDKNKTRLNIQDGLVVSNSVAGNKRQLILNNGKIVITDHCFFFDGFMGKFNALCFEESSKIERNQNNVGLVARFEKDLGNESFVLTEEQSNIVYDSVRKVVQVSAYPESNYKGHYLKTCLVELSEESPVFIKGFRDKGKKRMPHLYFDNHNGSIAGRVSGLYKNGYTIGFKMVGELLERFIGGLRQSRTADLKVMNLPLSPTELPSH